MNFHIYVYGGKEVQPQIECNGAFTLGLECVHIRNVTFEKNQIQTDIKYHAMYSNIFQYLRAVPSMQLTQRTLRLRVLIARI